MGLIQSLAGMVRLEITSADPTAILRKIMNSNIPLFDVSYCGELSVECTIYNLDFTYVKKILRRNGDQFKVVRKQGIHWTLGNLLRRPILTMGILTVILIAVYLPTRVLFVEVEGNEIISAGMILEKAKECGIGFGASRREVRSEKMKNELLAAIPDLQWAGVNTSGCVATISVKEKSVIQEDAESTGVSSVVASRDGIIYSCTVEQGSAQCKVGQAVKEGQVLVSGYTDSGLLVTATQAKAEIFALTKRDFLAVTSNQFLRRTFPREEKTLYSLLIGKKLIKFYKDSGISDATCVKMYEEEYMTLPGGFQLPVAIVRERYLYFDTAVSQDTEADVFSWLQMYSEDYILRQAVAGQILYRDTSLELQDMICSFSGQYACLEMIGKNRIEESIQEHGEND